MPSPTTVRLHNIVLDMLAPLALPSASPIITLGHTGNVRVPRDVWVEILDFAIFSPPDRAIFQRLMTHTRIEIDVGWDNSTAKALSQTCRCFRDIVDRFRLITASIDVALPLVCDYGQSGPRAFAPWSVCNFIRFADSLKWGQWISVRICLDSGVEHLDTRRRQAYSRFLRHVLHRSHSLIFHGMDACHRITHSPRSTELVGLTECLPELSSLILDHVCFRNSSSSPTLIGVLRLLPLLRYLRLNQVESVPSPDEGVVNYEQLEHVYFAGDACVLDGVLRHAQIKKNLRLRFELRSDDLTSHAPPSPSPLSLLTVTPATSKGVHCLQLFTVTAAAISPCPLLSDLRELELRNTNLDHAMLLRLNAATFPLLQHSLFFSCTFLAGDMKLWLHSTPTAMCAGQPFSVLMLHDPTVADGGAGSLLEWMKTRVHRLRWTGGGFDVDHVRGVDEEEDCASRDHADGHADAEEHDDAGEPPSAEPDNLESADEIRDDLDVELMLTVEGPEDADSQSTD